MMVTPNMKSQVSPSGQVKVYVELDDMRVVVEFREVGRPVLPGEELGLAVEYCELVAGLL